MAPAPPINRLHPVKCASTISRVTSDERTSAIDFINRQNYIFQEFNHDRMLATFLPDATVYHSERTLHGHAEIKTFFETCYGRAIPRICRSATNHVVDRDDEDEEGTGVVVRYQQYLIRVGWEGEREGEDGVAAAGKDVVTQDGLPAIWWFGSVVDRLRMTGEGWKVYERFVGPSFRNPRLDLAKGPKG
ncbi:hypothetical protein ASPCAL09586 [Aspergillus calidoustus]|uniref:SnoaL-like domain-containing protein n=1 Tax=Aspergillus calidoustus TaxID=454130 RepID=A0A0U5CS96_ASPCI|nr:hypothetical protein ASPCAL09586 [Aspergillus calidoustus]